LRRQLALALGFGLDAKRNCDFVCLASMAFVKTVDQTQYLLRAVTVIACPLAEGSAASAELGFELIWGHCCAPMSN
jgi:hypothetical protein